jgi:hypothetical protein
MIAVLHVGAMRRETLQLVVSAVRGPQGLVGVQRYASALLVAFDDELVLDAQCHPSYALWAVVPLVL